MYSGSPKNVYQGKQNICVDDFNAKSYPYINTFSTNGYLMHSPHHKELTLIYLHSCILSNWIDTFVTQSVL